MEIQNEIAVGEYILVELVMPAEIAEWQSKGIAVPQSTIDKYNRGTQVGKVISVGANVWCQYGDKASPPYAVGDIVRICRYSGQGLDGMVGTGFRYISDRDILGIVEKASNE